MTLTERLDAANPRKESMPRKNGSQNGRARGNGKVRVAIIGVGNCANALLQGVEYYKDASPDEFVPGLMHVDLGGYHVRDVEFTAAFDVTKAKVGKDLADAIWAKPNNTIKFAEVPKTGITVSRGMTHDGLGKYLSEIVDKAPYVWLPTPYLYTAWWPWVKNYGGELRAGAVRPGPIYARIWVDQELKKKMGY